MCDYLGNWRISHRRYSLYRINFSIRIGLFGYNFRKLFSENRKNTFLSKLIKKSLKFSPILHNFSKIIKKWALSTQYWNKCKLLIFENPCQIVTSSVGQKGCDYYEWGQYLTPWLRARTTFGSLVFLYRYDNFWKSIWKSGFFGRRCSTSLCNTSNQCLNNATCTITTAGKF